LFHINDDDDDDRDVMPCLPLAGFADRAFQEILLDVEGQEEVCDVESAGRFTWGAVYLQ
jgi:hypothetical protein